MKFVQIALSLQQYYEIMDNLFKQNIVNAARVMVVGCGALGNEVLKNLVQMGVRHMTVVDYDTIEPDNLTRSVLFTIDDAQQGRRKVDVVAERLKAMNSDVQVTTICGDIAYDVGLGLVRDMDVVIGCVDNRWARYCINRLCMRAGKPWVDGGIDRLEGTARVFRPGENCYACNLGPEGLRDLKFRMPCAGIVRRDMEAGKAPTTSIVASVIGAVEVQEALKLLHKEQLATGELTSLCGKMFCYEGQHLTTRLVNFKAYDDDCAVHDCWEPVVKSKITADMTVCEALEQLRQLTSDAQPHIQLTDCFVDWVERRTDGQQIQVMKPGRDVADYLERHTALKGAPQHALLQHEYSVLDDSFPYQELTLTEVGIPAWDVLQVTTTRNKVYVEMNDVRR